MNPPHTDRQLLLIFETLSAQGRPAIGSRELAATAGLSVATVKRALDRLQAEGRVVRYGSARATRYGLAQQGSSAVAAIVNPPEAGPHWSKQSHALRSKLAAPLAARDPVSYKREFVDRYVPNETWLLPEPLAVDLAQAGRMRDRQPAGTYARKVLEQLLIDLSWSSSRLEGNRYTLLDTKQLFEGGIADGDLDAIMLLNHKRAIEFLIDAVPEEGLSMSVIRNLHAVLMESLLADENGLGTIRSKVVNISDTVYIPAQAPSILQEMCERIIGKAKLIRNPIEAAFFLWINIAYLQPFEDGNKRTSRLAANIPLMLYNCAPLSFLDVEQSDYASAMMGVYELRDASIAIDLFKWIYRRSIMKYRVVLESMGVPNPLRLRYRNYLADAIGLIVRDRKTLSATLEELGLNENVAPGFQTMLENELATLEMFNYARYRLTSSVTEAWIEAGRPQ